MMLLHLKPHEAVRVERDRRGLNQDEAAQLCGWTRRLWVDLEKGRVSPPPAVCEAIERELGVPVSAWSVADAPTPEAATA